VSHASEHSARSRPSASVLRETNARKVRQGEVHFAYATDRDGFRNGNHVPIARAVVAIGDSWTCRVGSREAEA
jgi:hypothetical protein